MENLFIDILEITLPISAWIALLLLCSPLLKRSYVAKWRYFMWMFVAVRLVLPFRTHSQITMEIPSEISVLGAAAGTAVKSAPSVLQILTLVWIVGMAVFAIYQIISYFSFKCLVKRWSRSINNAKIEQAFKDAKSFVGVKRSVDIKLCRAVTTPMIFGMVRPVLLLPYVEFTDDELPIILRHELVHLRRHDIWYKLLLMAARTVHWFNPLAYIMTKAANMDMELACDAEVVKCENSEFRQHYCEAIMRLIHNGRGGKTALSTCFFFSKKTVMERFKNIVDDKIKRSGVMMFVIVAISVAISGSVITFATEQVAEVAEEDLQLIERPVEKPKSTAEPAPTLKEENNDVYIEPRYDKTSADTPVYDSANETDYYTDPVPNTDTDEEVTNIDESVTDIEQGADRESVYEQLGEPESVSKDGSKETYTLSDGSTAVVQYNEGVLDSGYIIVD